MDTHQIAAHDVAETESIRRAWRTAEDMLRREQPCVRCGRPIGPTADYVPHPHTSPGDQPIQYMHASCRCCEICEEVITGDYVETDVKQLFAPVVVHGVHVYSTPKLLTRLYYHAACAYHAGLTPTTRGPIHPVYGFATRRADNVVTVDAD
jgi:hypothetical protein